MTMLTDSELLRRYCLDRSENAFSELVQRHANLVYGAALRQLNGDADLARDVTQMVFTDLARKSRVLLQHGSLAGWLYTSARFSAAKLARSEERRQTREQRASLMNNSDSTPETLGDPAQLRPLIEEALDQLDNEDREAVLLRFCEGREFKTVGTLLGVSEEAARKRVVRAVERLRGILERRGISSAESALSAALGGAAALVLPPDLQASIVGSVAAESVSAPVSLFPLAQAKGMLLAAALGIGLAAGLLIQQRAISQVREQNKRLSDQLAAAQASPGNELGRSQSDLTAEELGRLRKEHSELLRLRDEVSRLRADRRQLAPNNAATAKPDEKAPVSPQVTIEAKFFEQSAAVMRKAAMDAIGLDITGVGITAVLTDAQFRALVPGLPPGDLLASPRVTTLDNRSAAIGAFAPDDGQNAGVHFGPSAEFLPTVSADHQSIALQASAALVEKVSEEDDTGNGSSQVRQTKISANGVLYDGQTLVLCQRVGQSGGSSSATAVQDDLSLFVFVSPVLIDPAGNRLHPTEEVPAKPADLQSGPPSR
jgi:RNA polymerase sigma factor (sigma-70 family)